MTLSLEAVTAGYHPRTPAIVDISLTVEEGQIVAVIGPNGAGKSTTLRTISGLLRPSQGRVMLGSVDLGTRSVASIVKAGVAQVPEGRRILPGLTVRENLLMGASALPVRQVPSQLQHVVALFPALRERLGQPGGTLSGGEQQMLAIGRALMSRPGFLLLDEPSMGLAPLIVTRIFNHIVALRDQGIGILLVEQNANLAMEVSSQTHVLEGGRIVLGGPSADLRANRKVKEAYLSAT